MHNKVLSKIATLVAVFMLMPMALQALSLSQFTQTSKLSTGKWVKIAVAVDGIYEITAEELSQMGFSDPERVAVYGSGGHLLSEVLDGSAPDDLRPVATMYAGDKLYFYGQGPVAMSLTSKGSVGMAFQRSLNVYSNKGYYFLTEENSPLRVKTASKDAPSTIVSPRTTSYNYWYHESDLTSLGQTGKDLLGEDLLVAPALLPYWLPNIASNTVVVGVRAAATSTDTSSITAELQYDDTSQDVRFSISDSKLYATSGTHWYYDINMPYMNVNLNSLAENGQMKVAIVPRMASVRPTQAKLDYATITYERENTFPSAEEGQFNMWFSSMSESDVVGMPQVGDDVVVWDLSDVQEPVAQKTLQVDDMVYFASSKDAPTMQMVAFSPNRNQLKIDGFEDVPNQNLHGLAVPDMLIVCNSSLKEQARRVAQLHEEHDGMRVALVTQEEVFNEFSSGTPDAMAVRLLCKMFYDRDMNKFKNLLMFGAATYDNRGIVQNKPYSLITYESDDSRDETTSYASEDFFGFMDDGAGANPETCLLRIGVGRFASSTPQEAKTDVDKLVDYVTNPDYGVWRNNFLMMADEGVNSSSDGYDIGLHVSQAEGVHDLWLSYAASMHANKAYVETFPHDATETSVTDVYKRTALEARRHVIESLNSGQYFMSYVGHAGGSVMTGKSKMWRSIDVQNNHYAHFPIMTTACCNVARYDSNTRGIAEVMFHERHGGAIALLTSSRGVYADQNDNLNRAFVKALFATDAEGNMPTLGEVYMKAKQSFGKYANYNKMSFFLLGDPAIRINYPRPLFEITAINGEPVTSESIVVNPMQRVTVEGRVKNRTDNDTNTSFSGNATLSLYGPSVFFTSYNISTGTWTERRDIYLERPLLAQVEGEVNNGVFTGSFVVPRYELSNGPLQLQAYAHCRGTEDMVNGSYSQLILGPYDETMAETDEEAPVIETMYLNDEASFAENAHVGSSAMLYIHATDDLGINTQHNSPGMSMRLQLDGNKTSYYTVKDYAVCSDEGRVVDVAFPLTGLSYGHHTLTYTIFDMAGHMTSRTINFVVGFSDALSLAATPSPAIDRVEFSIAESKLKIVPEVSLRVTDAQGNLVWTQTSSNFPVEWNMLDINGQRVPAGLYKYYGTYKSGSDYGGTSIENLIVVKPLSGE